ncbi:MAG: hypothetical protein JWR86_79, partial [Enterovirga sp.]|nr:hypothetical protein [Enterovirga sp.]
MIRSPARLPLRLLLSLGVALPVLDLARPAAAQPVPGVPAVGGVV